MTLTAIERRPAASSPRCPAAGWARRPTASSTGSPRRASRGGRCCRSGRPTGAGSPYKSRVGLRGLARAARRPGRAGVATDEADGVPRAPRGLDRRLGGLRRRPARGQRPGALRARVGALRRLRGRARRAADRRRADLRGARAAPTTAPIPSCSATTSSPASRRTRSPTRASCGATRSTTGPPLRRRALPLVDGAPAAHVRAVRHRADRPLPRLRRLLGGARRRARRARRALGARAGARRLRRRPRASSATSRSSPRTSASSPRRCARLRERPRPAGHGGAAVRLRARRPGRASHDPANHIEDQVLYTGTHDNDTLRGWWETLPEERRALVRCGRRRRRARRRGGT